MINFTLKNRSGPVFSRQLDWLGLVLLSPVGSTQYMGRSRTGCDCGCLISPTLFFFFGYLSILIYNFLFLISQSFTFMLSALHFIWFSVLLKKVGFFSFIFRLRYIYNVTFNEFIRFMYSLRLFNRWVDEFIGKNTRSSERWHANMWEASLFWICLLRYVSIFWLWNKITDSSRSSGGIFELKQHIVPKHRQFSTSNGSF